jgi:hypothetical protein
MEPPVLNKYYWGPEFWRVLHTLSCCAGTTTKEREERENWGRVLSAQEQVMPCSLCRNHYGAWLRERGIISNLQKIPMANFGEYVRRELYELHKRVNDINGKETPILYDDLFSKYPRINLRPDLIVLDGMFQKAQRFNQIRGDSVKNWKKGALNLCIIYQLP